MTTLEDQMQMCIDPSGPLATSALNGSGKYGNQAFLEDNELSGPTQSHADLCEASGEPRDFDDATFEKIQEMAPDILSWAEQNGVPASAVASAIADEYSTQRGFKGFLDTIQDKVLIGPMPNSWIELDVFVGADSKALNATKHDLGPGNIKLETAKHLLDTYPDQFPSGMDYAALVDYIQTNNGTAHLASLTILEAKTVLDPYLESFGDEEKDAFYVTYYKQGPIFLDKIKAALGENPNHEIRPGEGCDALFQRDEILAALEQGKADDALEALETQQAVEKNQCTVDDASGDDGLVELDDE